MPNLFFLDLNAITSLTVNKTLLTRKEKSNPSINLLTFLSITMVHFEDKLKDIVGHILLLLMNG